MGALVLSEGADIVEFNLRMDSSNMTAMVCAKILKEVAGQMLETMNKLSISNRLTILLETDETQLAGRPSSAFIVLLQVNAQQDLTLCVGIKI
jgi:hypothetical protein